MQRYTHRAAGEFGIKHITSLYNAFLWNKKRQLGRVKIKNNMINKTDEYVFWV